MVMVHGMIYGKLFSFQNLFFLFLLKSKPYEKKIIVSVGVAAHDFAGLHPASKKPVGI